MSFSVGIIGLPNVGKSTLFQALTKKKVDIAAYPFTTIHPNVGVVAVPDKRLKKIALVVRPEKITNTVIEFVDIAGLVKNAHKGEGLGNQFLSHIRNCDAVVEVIRDFRNPDIEHVEGDINPKRDIEIIKVELLMKDLETLEGLLPKIKKDIKKDKEIAKKFELLEKIKESVSQGKLISEIDLTDKEKTEIKEYQFLTAKPSVYLFNIDKEQEKPPCLKPQFKQLVMNLKNEQDLSGLSEPEIKELEMHSQLDQLIHTCYTVLDLITFFTITGGKETKAWTLKRGLSVIDAAEKVHTDFKERFIRAEVISWQELVAISGELSETGFAPKGREIWTKAKELGQIKTVGKEYIVQGGDVIEFRI